jgi:hypothetical protein
MIVSSAMTLGVREEHENGFEPAALPALLHGIATCALVVLTLLRRLERIKEAAAR